MRFYVKKVVASLRTDELTGAAHSREQPRPEGRWPEDRTWRAGLRAQSFSSRSPGVEVGVRPRSGYRHFQKFQLVGRISETSTSSVTTTWRDAIACQKHRQKPEGRCHWPEGRQASSISMLCQITSVFRFYNIQATHRTYLEWSLSYKHRRHCVCHSFVFNNQKAPRWVHLWHIGTIANHNWNKNPA